MQHILDNKEPQRGKRSKGTTRQEGKGKLKEERIKRGPQKGGTVSLVSYTVGKIMSCY